MDVFPLKGIVASVGIDVQTDSNDFRVIELARIVADFIQGGLNPQRRSVGTVRGHGFNRVRDADNPRFQQDVVARQAARLA